MHELSLCGAIMDTVSEHADGRSVRTVNLRIGHFRQVVPDTLQFCWQARTAGTDFEGCELRVDYVPATVRCDRCGTTTTLAHPILQCGSCDSTDVVLKTGEEFVIESVDLATDSSGHDTAGTSEENP